MPLVATPLHLQRGSRHPPCSPAPCSQPLAALPDAVASRLVAPPSISAANCRFITRVLALVAAVTLVLAANYRLMSRGWQRVGRAKPRGPITRGRGRGAGPRRVPATRPYLLWASQHRRSSYPQRRTWDLSCPEGGGAAIFACLQGQSLAFCLPSAG